MLRVRVSLPELPHRGLVSSALGGFCSQAHPKGLFCPDPIKIQNRNQNCPRVDTRAGLGLCMFPVVLQPLWFFLFPSFPALPRLRALQESVNVQAISLLS